MTDNVLAADLIVPKRYGHIRMGPMAAPSGPDDPATKGYVDTHPGFLPNFVPPLQYNAPDVSVDAASAASSGVLTTGAQTIAGAKTFQDALLAPTRPLLDATTNVATTAFVNSASAAANYSTNNGWVSGGLITFVPNTTTFSVSATTCRFTDYTNPAAPIPGPVVTLPAVNNITSANPAVSTGILIKSDGSIMQDTSGPSNTPALYSDYIHLGALVHVGGKIANVSNTKYPLAQQYDIAVVDMIQRIAPFNIGPNEVAASTTLPLDLSISVGGGIIWDHMSNVMTNRDVPSIKTIAAVDRPTLVRGWRNTAGDLIMSGASTQIDNTLYNPGGTGVALVPISAGYWVNFPIIYSSTANFYMIQYPNHQYMTKSAAISNIGHFERFSYRYMSAFNILGFVTIQQGMVDTSEAVFAAGQFFNYNIFDAETDVGPEEQISNNATIDQTFGDDSTGVVTMPGLSFLNHDPAAAKITTASSTNPFHIYMTPGSHTFPTMVIKPNIHITGDAQRACIVSVASNYITLHSSFATATNSTTGFYNFSTASGTNVNWDLRAVGGILPKSTMGLYSVFLGSTLNYTGRIYDSSVNNDSEDIFTAIACDFEEDTTFDGGEILLTNLESDAGTTITINATIANTTSTISGATGDRLVITGSTAGVTNVAQISASFFNYMEANGANVIVNVNRGSLPLVYHAYNGAVINIISDQLTTNEADGIAGALVPLSAGNVVVDSTTLTSSLSGKVDKTATVNGHNFTLGNVVIAGGDITTGTISKTVLPLPLAAADISQSLTSNTSGTAANLTAAALLPNGTTATTQINSDSSDKLATTQFISTRFSTLAGNPNGVATLDGAGKIPSSQIDLAGLGALSYQGVWDASVNHVYPVATTAQFWIVQVAGNVGPPSTYYNVGDWFIYNGTSFDKVAGSDIAGYLSTWTGSTSVTIVGTIATGTWNADVISSSKGGAGAVTGLLKANGSGVVSAALDDSDLVTPDYVSAAGDGTISGDKTLTGTVTATTQTYTDSSTKLATTAYVQSVANISQSNVIFMSSSGGYGDGYHDGTTIGKSIDTLVNALTAAAALIPSLNNQILIECFEARVDTAAAFPAYVNLEAPSMIINGALTINQNTSIRIKRFGTPGVPGSSITFTGSPVTTSYSNLFINRIYGAPITIAANQGLRILEVPIIDGFASTDPCITVNPGSTLYLKCAILYGLVTAVGVGSVIDLTQVGNITNATFSWNPANNLIKFPAGGAGNVTGILKGNGTGTITAASAPSDFLQHNESIVLNTDVAGTSVNAGGSTTITTTIQPGVVTLAKMANLAAGSVIGNPNFVSAAVPTAVAMDARATASTVVYRDSNINIAANHVTQAYQAQSMVGVDVILGLNSPPLQEFSGVTNTNAYLPNALLLENGFTFDIRNSSTTNSVLVYTFNVPPGTLLATVTAGLNTRFVLKNNLTQAGQWYQETIVATMPSGYIMGNITGSVNPPSLIPISSTMSANSTVLRDASQNSFSNNFVCFLSRTDTSTGTLNLTNASPSNQEWFGSTVGFKVYLPSYSTVSMGYTISATNTSTQSISVYVNGGVTPLQVMTSLMSANFVCNSAAADTWLVVPMNQLYTLSGTISGGSVAATPTTINTSIANGTLTGTMMASATITNANIAQNTITGGATGNLGLLAVTFDNIANTTITGGKIAANTITGGVSGNLVLSTVTADNIANATVTGTKIAANTIVGGASGNIALATITNVNITQNTITGGATGNLGLLAVTFDNIANATITGGKVAANTITGGVSGNLALATITVDNIVNATITGAKIAAATVTGGAGGNLAANTITAANIFAGTITGGTTGSIGSATVTAYNIASNTIVSGNLAANAVGLSNLPLIATDNVLGYFGGGTGTVAATSTVAAPTVSTVMYRDASANTYVNAVGQTLTSPTAGVTLVMTVASGTNQYFNSATPTTVDLPSASTLLYPGRRFFIINDGTGAVTVRNSAGTTLCIISQYARVSCINTTIASPGTWEMDTLSLLPRQTLFTNNFDGPALNTSITLTAAHLYNGPLKTGGSGNITLVFPSYANLITQMTAIIGYAPPVGFNWRAIFICIGNTTTFAIGGATYMNTTNTLALGSNSLAVFYIWITSLSTYNVLTAHTY